MKKLLLSVALIAGAFSLSFAQQKNVKEAKRLVNAVKPDFGQAEQLINEALENNETKNDASAWDMAGFVQLRKVEEEQKKQYLNQAYDTLGVYNSVSEMVKFYSKCDELSEIPNEKGKVKNKFRKANAKTLKAMRPELINGGVYFFNLNQDQDALNYFKAYLESAKLPIFEGEDLISSDENYKTIAYYGTLAAARLENNAEIINLAPLAIADSQEGMQALEFLSQAYKATEDFDGMTATLQKGIEMFPESFFFFGNLVDHYVGHEQAEKGLALADAMIEKDPTNSNYVFVKGYILHTLKDFDKAVELFKKATELNPEYAEAYSNIGLIYLNQGLEIINAIPADLPTNSNAYKKEEDKASELYREALQYYLKARELKPEESSLWIQGLYRIYYGLNMADEFREIESLM